MTRCTAPTGQPSAPEKEKKVAVQLRVTPAEYAAWKTAAAGEPLSRWMRTWLNCVALAPDALQYALQRAVIIRDDLNIIQNELAQRAGQEDIGRAVEYVLDMLAEAIRGLQHFQAHRVANDDQGRAARRGS